MIRKTPVDDTHTQSLRLHLHCDAAPRHGWMVGRFGAVTSGHHFWQAPRNTATARWIDRLKAAQLSAVALAGK